MSCERNGNAAANGGSSNGISKLSGQGSLATAGKALRFAVGKTDVQQRFETAERAYGAGIRRDLKAGQVVPALRKVGKRSLGVAAHQKAARTEIIGQGQAVLQSVANTGVVRALTGRTEPQRKAQGAVKDVIKWSFGQTDFQKRYRAAGQAYAREVGHDFKEGRPGAALKKVGKEALGTAAYQKAARGEARERNRAALNQARGAAGTAARGAFKAVTGQTGFQKRQRARVTGFVSEICESDHKLS